MMNDFDYRLTEKALSAMWGITVAYAKPGQSSVRLTPLNMHFEGVLLHEMMDGMYPNSDLISFYKANQTIPLTVCTDLIDPHYDYDFSSITDDQKHFRGTMEYIRPCGWKRLAISVNGVYDGGMNGWLSMKSKAGVWANSYMPTDFAKVKEYLKTQPSFEQLVNKTYSFDIGMVSMPDIEMAEKFAQSVEVNGVKYLFVLQNRVNPKAVRTICDGQVLISPKESIRPYGFLIKQQDSKH